LLCIFVAPLISLITVVNLGSTRGLCYYSSIFVPCLAFRIHVAGDLNQKLSFVASVLLTSFALALLGLIRLSPSRSLQLGI